MSIRRLTSGRKMVSLLLLGALALILAVSPSLAGCRKAEPPGPGQGQPGGHEGAPGSTRGGGAEPLRVVVSDPRRLYSRTGYDAFETGAYFETKVSPGQEVLIGQGNFSISLYWAKSVKLEAIRPFIVLDPPPAGGWNWMPEWTVGSALQVLYWESESSIPTFRVTIKAGLSLGGTETLAQDFAFTIARAEEPNMTASVVGFPWAKTPYARQVAGYVLPAGRHEVRFEFSPAPDHSAAESALLAAAPAVVESRWENDRTLVVTVDLASGADATVFDANGVAVPGTICLARLDPLVLAGREKTALACFKDPGNPAAEPKVTALPLPLDAGKLAIGGERALLLENVRNLYDASSEGPDLVPVPWVVDTGTGEAECLEGRFESNPVWMALGMYGWAADGRLVLPLRDTSTVVLDPWSGGPGGDVWPIIGPETPGLEACLSRAVSPDGRQLAWLELEPAAAGSQGTMRLVAIDLATAERTADYPAAAPAVLYDGVAYQRSPILWSPLGEICLPPQETLPAAELRVLDEASGVFVTREFLAPDGKPLDARAWTVHSSQAEWSANGRAVGYDAKRELLLASASGRKPLGLTSDGDPGPILEAAFSPDGSLLAVQAGNKVCLFRCPGGERVRELEGEFLGFTADGQLWLVVPAPGD